VALTDPWPADIGSRLLEDLDAVGLLGRSQTGGVSRVAFTPEFLAGRDLVRARMAEEGLTPWVDGAGNLFGRFGSSRPGPGEKVLLVGSHLDTVPDGGLLDGLYGVLAGLAAVGWLVRAHPAQATFVTLVGFCNEEGAFGTAGMTGSRALSGTIGPEELRRKDEAGVALADRLSRVATEPVEGCPWDASSLTGYLELHIEQGPVLESRQVPLGVVGTITGRSLFDIVVRGTQGHAGTTPMRGRSDALAAAAEVVLAIEHLGRSGQVRVATVGTVQCQPGSRNVIPGEVTLACELRDSSTDNMAEAIELLRTQLARLAADRSVTCELAVTSVVDPIASDPSLKAALVRAAARLGQSTLEIDSGAGHDAQAVSLLAPVAMLFVPSRTGASHCPDEWTSPEALALGARTLAEALAELTAPEAWGAAATPTGPPGTRGRWP
jgi:hydantoinase/carbamoylase family amidase